MKKGQSPIQDEFSHIPDRHKRCRLRKIRDKVCTYCGIEKAVNGYYCAACISKARMNAAKVRRKKGIAIKIYKIPSEIKARKLACLLKWRRKNRLTWNAYTRANQRKLGRRKRCQFPNCREFRRGQLYCKEHNLQNLLGGPDAYQQVLAIFRRFRINKVSLEFMLVAAVLNEAVQEVRYRCPIKIR